MPDTIPLVDDVTLDEIEDDSMNQIPGEVIRPVEPAIADDVVSEISIDSADTSAPQVVADTAKNDKTSQSAVKSKGKVSSAKPAPIIADSVTGTPADTATDQAVAPTSNNAVADPTLNPTADPAANPTTPASVPNGLPKVQPLKVTAPNPTKPVNRPVMRSSTLPMNQNTNQNTFPNRKPAVTELARLVPITGVLDMSREGHGVIRVGYSEDDNDAFISTSLVRRYGLLQGDIITGMAREPKENDRYFGLVQIDKINDYTPEEWSKKTRNKFHRLTPVYPDSKITLEVGPEPLSLRIIDLIAPIGKGQRSLIVSPPKAGKTILLKDIASGVATNHPEIHLMAVLVGERPEEVTDIRRHIASLTKGRGEVAASNFDEPAKDQCRVAELALERAKRLVEVGEDVLLLLDSITRLARAYNLAMPTSGRTLSGGFDPAALFPPKRFFGAARNFEVKGSLTIIGTALVETGSRMDDLIYEEFKGTGNQEVHLVRRLAERRIFPAIEVQKSGTRRDDLLMDGITYQSIITLQRMLDMIDPNDRTVTLIDQLKKSKSNKEFLASLKSG